MFVAIVDLSSAITTDSLQAVLNDPNMVQNLQQHLPSVGSGNVQEHLRSTLASPQFTQVSIINDKYSMLYKQLK